MSHPENKELTDSEAAAQRLSSVESRLAIVEYRQARIETMFLELQSDIQQLSKGFAEIRLLFSVKLKTEE